VTLDHDHTPKPGLPSVIGHREADHAPTDDNDVVAL
jgi:hypothetical protein